MSTASVQDHSNNSADPTSNLHHVHHSPPEVKAESTNAVWIKLQTLDDDLKIFLLHGVEKSSDGVTCLKIYRILVHFNPKTKARPHHLKDKLWDEFTKDVLPLLKNHMTPPPQASMQTDPSSFDDFNPLNRKTTRQQLIDAVRSVNKRISIPATSPRDRLLVLYKAFIDKDLQLGWLTEFIKSPNIVKQERVKDLSMEELRMTLQVHAPHVFIHLGPMNLSVLMNLYIRFVIEEQVSDDLLVKGFHYSLFYKSADSMDS